MYKPPFQITPKILKLVAQIHEIIGELKGHEMTKPSVKLRRENKIKTVHHSLAIEGNSLTEEQVTAILENRRVLGPQKQIVEVRNAVELYDRVSSLDAFKEKDLLKAHQILMKDLVPSAGKFRSGQVGVFKGSKVSHMAPPVKQVPKLVKDLFDFLKKDAETSLLIKACVFHYELEFIHPFEDGNGRMGRLWQQLILMKHASLFEYVPVETLIHKKQALYYKVLEACDKSGDSTAFIEFSLEMIFLSLQDFQNIYRPTKASGGDRVMAALAHFSTKSFSRKDYMNFHKGISTATASRDLNSAVEEGLLKKDGEKSLTKYRQK
jgi:Fic family protein